MPRAILVVLALLACAEGVARYGVAKGKLTVGSTGRSVIIKHVEELKAKKPEIWLLGNSMLDAGIDQDKFSDALGKKAVKLPMGSATVRASSALLARYLRDVPTKPTKVMLFISPDDLNLQGNRMSVSAEIERIANGAWRRPQEFLMLYTARASIVSRFTYRFNQAATADPAEEGAGTAAFNPLPVTESNYDTYDWLVTLVKKYEMDDSAIPLFAATAKQAGINDVTIVLMPTTDLFQRFHDDINPQFLYTQIHERIAKDCKDAGITFIDHGQGMTQYKLFKDLYHLTKDHGREMYTAKIVAELGGPAAMQPSTSPSTSPTITP